MNNSYILYNYIINAYRYRSKVNTLRAHDNERTRKY